MDNCTIKQQFQHKSIHLHWLIGLNETAIRHCEELRKVTTQGNAAESLRRGEGDG